MAGSGEMQELLARVYDSFNTGDASLWTESLADDVVGIGSDPDEWWEGSALVARVGTAQVEQMSAAGVQIRAGSPSVFGDGAVLWAVDRPTIFLRDGTATPMRFTLVATRAGDQLRINHFHLSAGARNEEVIGEHLPTS